MYVTYITTLHYFLCFRVAVSNHRCFRLLYCRLGYSDFKTSVEHYCLRSQILFSVNEGFLPAVVGETSCRGIPCDCSSTTIVSRKRAYKYMKYTYDKVHYTRSTIPQIVTCRVRLSVIHFELKPFFLICLIKHIYIYILKLNVSKIICDTAICAFNDYLIVVRDDAELVVRQRLTK